MTEGRRGAQDLSAPDRPQHSRLVVVPCGSRKRDTPVPVPAGDLYAGSYHRACRRAADALTGALGAGGRVLILSARHGLLELHHPVATYDLRAGRAGTVGAVALCAQADALGVTGAHAVVLAGRAYAELARLVWPDACLPLAGTRGIGEQMSRLAAIRAAAICPAGVHRLGEGAGENGCCRRAETS
ncbi:DUF6884 domain-containing protein [Nonomuraea sp. NPDC049646]|uniref:DUF6884 domain-containing protein n=1 Tax=unclassified Nonomuraea TaxID=2593643 RepID=UPI0037B2CE30